MYVDPKTMLIYDFGNIDQKRLYSDILILTLDGIITDLVREVSRDWSEQCGLDDRQWLMVLSTLFPQKLLISIIEYNNFFSQL